LFDRFHEELERQGFSAKSGIIVDGSFVEVPSNEIPKKKIHKSNRERFTRRVIEIIP
jgi:hypothetical protein